MAKEFCHKCGFSYEGGCPRHSVKTEEPVKKLSLLKRLINKVRGK